MASAQEEANKKLSKKNAYMLHSTCRLLKFNSYSGNESIIYDYLIGQLKGMGFTVEQDDIGNIMATRGTALLYPTLNAHMDIVDNYDEKLLDQSLIKQEEKTSFKRKKYKYKDKTKVEVTKSDVKTCKSCDYYDDCVSIARKATPTLSYFEAVQELEDQELAKNCSQYKLDPWYEDESDLYYGYNYYDSYYTGYSWSKVTYTAEERKAIDVDIDKKLKISFDAKTMKIVGNGVRLIGGDDKCGISIAMQVARETKVPMKLIFTVKEEIGCVGMKYIVDKHKEWLSDLDYSITIDRRGGNHLLYQSCSVANCSAGFAGWATQKALEVGLVPSLQNGSVADVLYLRNYCEALNISAGYYDPHMVSEYIKFDEMILIKEWVKNMILS